MPEKHTEKLRISSKSAPVVTLTGEGSATYIYFNRGAKYSHTISKSDWPVLAIDVAEDGSVIGVESIGFREITLTAILKKAGLKVPASLASRAKYVVDEKQLAAA